MYLFTRTGQLRPARARQGIAFAQDVVERVNRITDLGVGCYLQMFSPQSGTISWTAMVPDLATLETANDKLLVDNDYLTATEQGAELLMGPVDDQLRQIVHGTPDPSRHIEYVGAVRAVCANGRIADGMGVGVRIAQEAERITGGPTLFVAETTGAYGGVGWITPFADIAEMERSQQALVADPAWVELIDREAGPVYLAGPDVTTQRIFRRIA